MTHLESLGLSQLEARTYLVLVTGPRSARDLADELGISRTRASALLTGLTQRGLLKRLPGRTTRYGVVAPDPPLPGFLGGFAVCFGPPAA